MLTFGIRYLNGFVAACEPDSRERPEWPPHPGRIFMALAAAHFASPSDPAEREALLWLERLPPPQIYASGHLQRASVTHFVPVNDKSGPAKALIHSLPLTRDRQARTFTRAYLEDDIAYLSWPDAAPDATVLNALDRLCQKVTRIGHSMSLVQMWIASPQELRTPNWVPDNQRAVLHLRVPAPGTLHQLERYYNAAAVSRYCELKTREAEASNAKQRRQIKKDLDQEFPADFVPHYRPQLSAYQGYARAVAHPSRVAAPGTLLSPHLLLFTLARLDGPYLHLDLPLSLGFLYYWRQALLAHCHNVADEVGAIISGHQPNGEPLESPHLAFLPLGFVEHEHADGRLLGIAISLPHDLNPAVRRQILRVIGRVQLVRAGRLGSWRIERPTAASPPFNLIAETWTAFPKGATHWSTVTPMVLDRHPKEHDPLQYQRELEETVAVACQRMGLPQPASIIPTAVSAHLGVPPSHAFPRLQRKDGSLRRHVHLILAFHEPVCGPILLGAGRYRGYGLLRPIHSPT